MPQLIIQVNSNMNVKLFYKLLAYLYCFGIKHWRHALQGKQL